MHVFFTLSPVGRSYCQYQIANMDLFAPNKDQNKYGARQKKNVSKQVLPFRLCL